MENLSPFTQIELKRFTSVAFILTYSVSSIILFEIRHTIFGSEKKKGEKIWPFYFTFVALLPTLCQTLFRGKVEYWSFSGCVLMHLLVGIPAIAHNIT